MLAAVERTGFTPYTPLSDEDVAEIMRAGGPQQPLARAWHKVLRHARAEAIRRCQVHLQSIKRLRTEIFAQTHPPFRNVPAAKSWVLSVLGVQPGEETLPPTSFILWLKGEDKYGPYEFGTMIDRLIRPVEWLGEAAGVSRKEALLFLLSGDVIPDPPIQATINGKYGRPPRVEVRAEDYVPAKLVAYARAEGRRLAGLGERSRPGPRRENVSPPPRLLDLVVSGEVECTELGIEADAPTTRGPFWKFMAPGMDRRPDRYSSSFSRAALESDGVRSLVLDTITCEWDINPFQDFELFTSL